MTIEAEVNKNHSLGSLRPAKKTKPKSPDCTGKLLLRREHLLVFLKQLEQSQEEAVACSIAGWKGNGVYGPFMTIEISPRFEKRLESHNSDPFPDFAECKDSLYRQLGYDPTSCSIWNQTNRQPRRVTMTNKQGCSLVTRNCQTEELRCHHTKIHEFSP
jgi:hypothetical protein